jgi:SAM-dependent methyltransferase
MTLLGPRRSELERIDEPALVPSELALALHHVAAVNRWLGGERSVRRHLSVLGSEDLRVLDVGTGNGAVARRLRTWAARRGGRWHTVGLDLHPQVLALAREPSPGASPLPLVRADALALPFPDGSFEVALCTLTLHHFEDEAAARLVSELARVASRLVLVSDLERVTPAYLFARLFALTWWRRSALTRGDGPLSVLRSFTADELGEIGRSGGLGRARVHRHFPFRLVLAGRP